MAEIAREADVSEKIVFNYFATKEDLVYWRLESFEHELLDAIHDRRKARACSRVRPLRARAARPARRRRRGQREQLAALTRTIVESPALLAREERIFAGYTRSPAALIAEERHDAATGRGAGSVEPWVVANALIGVHRALIDFARGLGDYGRE